MEEERESLKSKTIEQLGNHKEMKCKNCNKNMSTLTNDNKEIYYCQNCSKDIKNKKEIKDEKELTNQFQDKSANKGSKEINLSDNNMKKSLVSKNEINDSVTPLYNPNNNMDVNNYNNKRILNEKSNIKGQNNLNLVLNNNIDNENNNKNIESQNKKYDNGPKNTSEEKSSNAHKFINNENKKADNCESKQMNKIENKKSNIDDIGKNLNNEGNQNNENNKTNKSYSINSDNNQENVRDEEGKKNEYNDDSIINNKGEAKVNLANLLNNISNRIKNIKLSYIIIGVLFWLFQYASLS